MNGTEYFRFVDRGMSNKQTCELVAINYRTSRTWRDGHRTPGAGH